MKETKFKVWDIKESRMLIGGINDLITIDMEGLIYYKGEFKPEYQERFVILFYTGSNDKNNKEIYDQDIIKMMYSCHIDYKHEESIVKVEWSSNSWSWCLGYEAKISGSIKDIELIGNIYQNPELLNSIESKGGQKSNE